MTFLFWGAVALIVYVVVIYPVILLILAVLIGKSPKKRDYIPPLSLILAVCNEEKVIAAKLENSLKLNYPPDQLEIIVVTDEGSTDQTAAIAASFVERGVIFIELEPGKRGKNLSLDTAVGIATGELLLFTDGSAILTPDTPRFLTAHFADESVGCVAGRLVFHRSQEFRKGGYRSYWNLENILQRASSRLGYLPVASGGLHMMRRELYRPGPNHVIRDMVDPGQVAGRGFRVLFEPQAVAFEEPWGGIVNVLRARTRITTRGLSSTPVVIRDLLSGGRILPIFMLLSNKVMRWFLWLPLMGNFLAALALAPHSLFYAVIAKLQLVFYIFVLLGLTPLRHRIPLLSPLTFFVLNLFAMGIGALHWVSGRTRTTWRESPDPFLKDCKT